MDKLDFYFALALIAIFGSAASLSLEFQNAGYEYDNLTSSLAAPLIRTSNTASEINSVANIQAELDNLGLELEKLDLEPSSK